jgi:hypothetical protein
VGQYIFAGSSSLSALFNILCRYLQKCVRKFIFLNK